MINELISLEMLSLSNSVIRNFLTDIHAIMHGLDIAVFLIEPIILSDYILIEIEPCSNECTFPVSKHL